MRSHGAPVLADEASRRWARCSRRLASLLLVAVTVSPGASPPNRTLNFGLLRLPPLSYRDAQNRPAGFVVEAIDEAARRAGYRIEWRDSHAMQGNTDALRSGEFDMISGTPTSERRREFYVTEPWWSLDMVAVTLGAGPIRSDADLGGRVLAVPEASIVFVSGHYRGSRIVGTPTTTGAVEEVCSGNADAALIPDTFVRSLLLDAPVACRGVSLRVIDATVRSELALIARHGMEKPARELRQALDELSAEGALANIASRYAPLSSSRVTHVLELSRLRLQRRIAQIGGAAFFVVAVLCVVFLIRLRRYNKRLQRDLEARMRAEAALRESEARFRALFDSAPQTVAAIDRNGIIVFVNRRAEEMFGRPCEQFVGKSLEAALPERLHAGFRENRLAGIADIRGLRADGKEFPIEMNLSPVMTGEGLTLAFIADISERTALQKQLLQAQKLESVGRLTGGVAHDFNNLLTIISGYAQMLLQTPGAGEGLEEPLREIVSAADRATSLTRQLLMFSRQQAGAPRIIALNELLGNVKKMLARVIGEDIELTLSLDPRVANVKIDPVHIEQVVLNLALNARDAMPQGGKLIIETATFRTAGEHAGSLAELPPGEYAVLKVSDNGTGMSPEVQAHIFEPFFTTKERGKGTGLGLSTVYGIVKQSEGAITVYSEREKGTTFKVYLPAVEEAQSKEARLEEDPSAIAGSETVLLAEDESGVRKFVADTLRSRGYSVLEAANGRAALNTAATYEDPIHILLTDVVMPEVGGIELARRFAKEHPGCPALLMSGYSDRLVPADLAASLIEKPFTAITLLRRVREALDSHKEPIASPGPKL